MPDLFEATIATPLAEMVGDGVRANLLLVRLLRVGGNRKRVPLTASLEPIQDVVEHAIEWNLANIAAFGGSQIRLDIGSKCFGRKLGRDTTHDWVPPVLGIRHLPHPGRWRPNQGSKVSVSSMTKPGATGWPSARMTRSS